MDQVADEVGLVRSADVVVIGQPELAGDGPGGRESRPPGQDLVPMPSDPALAHGQQVIAPGSDDGRQQASRDEAGYPLVGRVPPLGIRPGSIGEPAPPLVASRQPLPRVQFRVEAGAQLDDVEALPHPGFGHAAELRVGPHSIGERAPPGVCQPQERLAALCDQIPQTRVGEHYWGAAVQACRQLLPVDLGVANERAALIEYLLSAGPA